MCQSARSSFPAPSNLFRWILFAAVYWPCSASDPAPFSVPVSTDFLGDDGFWSPITIRVGTPPQYLSALPNTASQETWVIGPGGCDGTYTCQNARGGVFFPDQSTTFANLGVQYLGTDPQFGGSDYGDYGLDSLALSDQDTVSAQVVAVLNTTDVWFGQFGLGVAQTRFNGTTDHLTFLSSLVEEAGLIPSHSYGYTAGAYYRLTNVPASLTLGGVDTNRFTSNSATFILDPNQKPTVAVNKITVSAGSTNLSTSPDWAANPLTLLDDTQADLFTVDSSTPFLWLPEAVCDAFADALGLVYDEQLQLYLFGSNGTSPSVLDAWSLQFVFSISDYPGSSSNVIRLNLPYSAFDLQLSYPFPGFQGNFTSPPINYFPLRKATSAQQYTLGRAFLQETYLTVDYERNNFSISQAKFPLDALTNIHLVPITRPINSNWTGPGNADPPASPGTAVKAGVSIAVAVVILSIAALCWYIFVFRKSRKAKQGTRLPDKEAPSDGSPSELAGDTRHRHLELPASRRFPTEAPTDASYTRVELEGDVPIEMPAVEEVPATFYASASGTVHSKNDPRDPAELAQGQRLSIQKSRLHIPGSNSNNTEHDRLNPQIPPPYTPSSTGTGGISNSVSPNSPRHSGGVPGTHTTNSSDLIVSPVSSGHSRNPPSPMDPPGLFSPLSASGAPAFPIRLPEQMQLDGYRLRGTSPLNSLRVGNMLQAQHADDDEEGLELDERPRKFSWEGSEM